MSIVCGFSDLASGIGGLAWRLGDAGGLILGEDGVSEAQAEIAGDDDAPELRLTSAAGDAVAKLSPRTGRSELEPAEGTSPGGRLDAAICTAEVEPPAQDRKLRCFGYLTTWPEDPSAGAAAFRHLAIERSDGSLLLVVTRGEDGGGHGDEQTSAWLLDTEGGVTAFGEALLSTQYDGEGRATRAGLELWPGGEEAPPMRAAGTRLGGSEGDGSLSAALLRCSTEGSEGLGGYLIKRA